VRQRVWFACFTVLVMSGNVYYSGVRWLVGGADVCMWMIDRMLEGLSSEIQM
jgi:hypothetical protein